ncbi:MAG: MaoC family dehydratase [Dehalococcoidia bacterium]|nr:MaoC family dehydratase [Dehalococcoidia bacterium]MCK5180907.1 MaoC family dehydratase [Dehalococcoidia bacterium]
MLTEIQEGKVFDPVVKHITQENINLYAEASGDFNPIHIDESFAAKTPLGGTIAHGMLSLAYVSEMMTSAFGQNWLSEGKLRAKFKEPARPGDTLTINGKIICLEQRDDVSYANCSFECLNQKGEMIVTGETTVKFSSDSK